MLCPLGIFSTIWYIRYIRDFFVYFSRFGILRQEKNLAALGSLQTAYLPTLV
jgi:hypothetical protein